MGYCYDTRNRLCCDNCGKPGEVRKRKCPHTVLTDSLRSPRLHLSYCYPPALCAACVTKLGGLKAIHADCAEGARKSQEEYDEIERKLDAGESFVTSACGDWQATVPEGMVGVTFSGKGGQVRCLMPASDYDSDERPALSDYPQAQPWPES